MDQLATIPRALVLLTVQWSGPERHGRIKFRQAVEKLNAAHPGLLELVVLDEEDEGCQRWLATLGIPQLGTSTRLGAGSMIWLENGRSVSHEIGGCALSVGEIVERTVALWRPNETQGAPKLATLDFGI